MKLSFTVEFQVPYGTSRDKVREWMAGRLQDDWWKLLETTPGSELLSAGEMGALHRGELWPTAP